MGEGEKDPRVTLAEERTELAIFRVSLALDRTTLAWVRTTLTMSSFGLGMIAFFRTIRMEVHTPESVRLHEAAIRFGVALLVIGVVATGLVAVSHVSALRKLRAGEMPMGGEVAAEYYACVAASFAGALGAMEYVSWVETTVAVAYWKP